MRVSLAPYAKHMNCGLLLVLKSAQTTTQGISSKPSAVPPPTQNLTTRMAMLVPTAMKAAGTTPPALVDLAATPTAWTTHVVGIALVVATITLTMLTAAHSGD